jgi:hypothetical protein
MLYTISYIIVYHVLLYVYILRNDTTSTGFLLYNIYYSISYMFIYTETTRLVQVLLLYIINYIVLYVYILRNGTTSTGCVVCLTEPDNPMIVLATRYCI